MKLSQVLFHLITLHLLVHLFITQQAFVHSQNPESHDTVLQYCSSKPPEDRTQWERYICEEIADERLNANCWPQRRFAQGFDTSDTRRHARGVIVMFHGYTACPDSYNHMATALQSNGFHVYSFLTVGHGRKYQDCTREGSRCVNGDPVEGLPISREDYIQFTQRVNEIIKEEIKLIFKEDAISTSKMVGAVGLSLGSALSSIATSNGQGLYKKQILFAPFFGMSIPGVDRMVSDCTSISLDQCIEKFASTLVYGVASSIISGSKVDQENATELIRTTKSLLADYISNNIDTTKIHVGFAELQLIVRNLIVLSAEHPNLIPSSIGSRIESGEFGWGDQCEIDRWNQSRGGYCNFRVKNLFATHSIGQYGISSSRNIQNVETTYVTVQRDGITRNSMVFQAAQALYRRKNIVQACMYRIRSECSSSNLDNTCGVPHSMISPADNMGIVPYHMYWEDGMISNTVKYFLNDNVAFGVDEFNNNPSECVHQNVMNPNPNLVGPAPQFATLLLKSAVEKISSELIQSISRDIHNKTGIPDFWLMGMISNLIKSRSLETHTSQNEALSGSGALLEGGAILKGEELRLTLELPSNLLSNLVQMIQDGELHQVANMEVLGIIPDGADGPIRPHTRGSSVWLLLLFIIPVFGLIAIAIILGIVIGAWKIKSRSQSRSRPVQTNRESMYYAFDENL